ncbi:PREDICTED: piggyBac transposable element-derived protein 4-like, partial [Polistes dominula]|uniref:PiggyBac transposable element-derived protein 4-like n=1 Tax=Polistes dominula TaxID=743375 RepID=A0ABM1I4X1_POLDO
MENNSKFSDIVSTSAKRNRLVIRFDTDTDSDCEEIVCSFRKRCRIIVSDSEEESSSEDCELNFISEEWIWENKENNRSNHYVSQTLGNTARKINKSEENWRDTNIDEIHAYFALCILMARLKKSNIQSYWSRKSLIETPIFRKTISLQRFTQLSHFLHFSNNEVVDKDDCLCKLRNIIDYLNEKFTSIYTPEEYVSLNVSLMKYTGQDTVKNSITSASENVTMFMFTPISNFGHTLFLDNSYSSPNLFQKLQSIKTNAIGTVRCNRKNMPNDLAKIKLKRSETISRSCKDIAQQILESVYIPEYINRGRPSTGDIPMRLQSKYLGHLA